MNKFVGFLARIFCKTNGELEMPVALIETAADEADLPSGQHLITRIWGNAAQEDYTDRVVHTGVDEFFEPEKENA